jgi:DNA (cytosine-5)-methyltransferase 1
MATVPTGRMTFGSLFSGIGGLDLGLERAGMECRWQVEIDEFCQEVLQRRFPTVPRFGDIRGLSGNELQPVDLICGGFPCQPHSTSGQKRGSADERDLWGEFARIICEVRPRWVLAENVRGLLSTESGRFFGRVLRDLARSGYDAEWQVLPAAAFGAPHIRERVFILAHTASDGRKQGGRAASWSGTLASIGGSGRGGFIGQEHWAIEPSLDRVVNGVPRRVDRLRGLGNAVVPQVAEFIGRAILSSEVGT